MKLKDIHEELKEVIDLYKNGYMNDVLLIEAISKIDEDMARVIEYKEV